MSRRRHFDEYYGVFAARNIGTYNSLEDTCEYIVKWFEQNYGGKGQYKLAHFLGYVTLMARVKACIPTDDVIAMLKMKSIKHVVTEDRPDRMRIEIQEPMTEARLQENPLIERPNLEPAYNYAKGKHDTTGAIRKHSGDPYWVHPSGVADLAVAYGGDDVEVEVAMCHDTLEDTDATFEEIADQFGADVAGYVQEITNDRDEIDKIGKEAYISKELCNLSHPALFVKLCDFLYNMLDYPKEAQAKRMVTNIEYMLDNRKDLNDRELELVDAICMAAEHIA